MNKRDLLSICNLSVADLSWLIERSCSIAQVNAKVLPILSGRVVGIYFRRTSTRTRTSFSVAALKLGAGIVSFGPNDLQTTTGESLEDTGRILAGYIDALVVRTAASIAEMRCLADQETMPVINAMSDNEHPTQALADLAVMKDHFGTLDGLQILYLGEGNNTAAALALAASRCSGTCLTLATPSAYSLSASVLEQAKSYGKACGSRIEEFHSIEDLPRHVDVVYTTRWQTTGTTKADFKWREAFAPFQVTSAVMKRVSKSYGTAFMHDLPAVRGEDVESNVIDGEQSIVFKQAKFKLYSAMAVLEWCLNMGGNNQTEGLSLSCERQKSALV